MKPLQGGTRVASHRVPGYPQAVQHHDDLPVDSSWAKLTPRALALRIIVSVAGLFALVTLLGWLLHDPLSRLGTWVVEQAGIPGLALLVFVLDPMPGLGFIPALVVGTAAGVHPPSLLVVTALMSWLSSGVGWFLGKHLGQTRLIRGILDLTSATVLVGRWRERAVAIAAVTPMPYGLATMAAGALNMPLRNLMFAAAARWIKITVSLGAIHTGWNLSDG
jgi:membrane protein YqaA with SNARE-associated domain